MKKLLLFSLLLPLPLLFAPKAQALRCSDFEYWEDAQGYSQLDRDGDGSACESLPRRGSSYSPSRPTSRPASRPANRPTNRTPDQPSDRIGTIVSAGGDTHIFEIASSLPRGNYNYRTMSGGVGYQGTVKLTSRAIDQIGNITATGSFADSSSNGNGCLGRFKIVYFPQSQQFTSVWSVDGTASGVCPVVGKTFELREMTMQ